MREVYKVMREDKSRRLLFPRRGKVVYNNKINRKAFRRARAETAPHRARRFSLGPREARGEIALSAFGDFYSPRVRRCSRRARLSPRPITKNEIYVFAEL